MRKEELLSLLKEQMQHEERETEVYARKVRETDHSVVKLVYAKLMRDSIHHADVLNFAITYLAKSEWESTPVKENRDELLQLMNLEEEALRLFTRASTQVTDPHRSSQCSHRTKNNTTPCFDTFLKISRTRRRR